MLKKLFWLNVLHFNFERTVTEGGREAERERCVRTEKQPPISRHFCSYRRTQKTRTTLLLNIPQQPTMNMNKTTLSFPISFAAEPIGLAYYSKTKTVVFLLLHAIRRETWNKPICSRCGDWKDPISKMSLLEPLWLWRRWRLGGKDHPISETPPTPLIAPVFAPSTRKSLVRLLFLSFFSFL